MGSVHAQIDTPTSKKFFDVQVQSLEPALLAFSEQAGVQIIASTELLATHVGVAVNGYYTPDEALAKILSLTPLEFEFASGDTVFIKARGARPEDDLSNADDLLGSKNRQNTNLLGAEDSAGWFGADSDVIIVTGTRLRDEAYTGVVPIEIINPELALLRGDLTTADMVRKSPLAQGSFQTNQQLGATAPGGRITNGGSGSNGLSLRGLGNQRSLIILDGRRLSPAGIKGLVSSVDLNVIPASALERVEIIKDGSSSVYGADAIAGVVNSVTKKDYDGGAILFNGTFPTKGAGEKIFASANFGKKFDRGWISAAGEFSQELRLKVRDRSFLRCAEDIVFNPENGLRADLLAPDGSFKCRNHNPNGAFFSADFSDSTFQPDPNGDLVGLPGDSMTRQFLPDWARVGNTGLTDSAEERASFAPRRETSEAYDNADALSPLKRYGFFINGERDLGGQTQAYGNFLFNHRESEFNTWMFLFQALSEDNPNNTVAAGLRAASGGVSTGAIHYQLVRPVNSEQSLNYFSGVAGLNGVFEGSFVHDWEWDVFTSYGTSRGRYSQGFLYEDRLNAISLGTTACDTSFLISEISPDDICDGIDIPILESRFLVDQDWTAQEFEFLEGRDTGKTTYEQFVVEGTFSGTVLNLPAGPLEAVIGGAFRRDSIDDQPGPNAQAGNLHLFSSSERTAGSEDAREVFAEIGAPILLEQPFAHKLSVVGSARYTNYKISRGKFTYKAGMNWAITPDITIRGSYGTSFRGPNLFELFLANSVTFNFVNDPCQEFADSPTPAIIANCTSLGIPDDFRPSLRDVKILTGGAALGDGEVNIKPETARSFEVGIIVARPEIGVTLSLNYFDIELTDEINTLDAQQILTACYGGIDFVSNPFCNQIERTGAGPANGALPFHLVSIDRRFINIDSQRTNGIDFLLSYNKEFSPFRLAVDIQGIVEFEDKIFRDIGGDLMVTNISGEPNEPKFNGSIDLVASRGNWAFYYNLIGIGSSGLTSTFGGNTFNFFNGYNGELLREDLETGFTAYHTVSLSKRLNNGFQFGIGVNNILDQDPPRVSVDWKFNGLRTGVAAQNSWDLRGRRIFLNLKKEF